MAMRVFGPFGKHKGPEEIEIILAKAKKGDPRAQYEAGVIYQEGRGVTQDHKEAAKWFRLAAEEAARRDDFSEFCMGVLLRDMLIDNTSDHEEAAKLFKEVAENGLRETGLSESQVIEHSIRWLRMGAERGNVFAQRNLGFLYQEAVPPNYDESAKWMTLAAEQGDIIAQRNLGYLYENGLGVPKDPKEAAKWYKLAEEQRNVS